MVQWKNFLWNNSFLNWTMITVTYNCCVKIWTPVLMGLRASQQSDKILVNLELFIDPIFKVFIEFNEATVS